MYFSLCVCLQQTEVQKLKATTEKETYMLITVDNGLMQNM